MPRTVYCWRCRTEVPMLTEDEWTLVGPRLSDGIEQIQHYRKLHGCSIAEAKEKGFGLEALRVYHEITGFVETNGQALYHHRLSLLGPDCHVCGKPLRTPRARLCAECWAPRAGITGTPESPTP